MAAVEFAVVAPLFFLLVFGMIEFGRAMMVQQIVTNASREGARVAVLDDVDGNAAPEVTTTVVNYMQRAGIAITPDMVLIDPPNPTSVPNGTEVRVTVSVPFSQVSWLPGSWFTGRWTTWFTGGTGPHLEKLSASTVMRRETVQ